LEKLQIEEVTDSWAVLALMGPQSRRVIERTFPAVDFSNVAFPPGTAQELGGGVRALRVSFVGELGWELHCPQESAPALWSALHAAGKQANVNDGVGLINAGYRALLLSLRLEKRFVHFGHDVSPSDSPIEAGLGWVSAAKLKAGTPFLGREALLAQKAEGLTKRLVNFSVKAGQELQETSLWGGEGIYRDGVRVGHLTSGGIGHTVNDGRAIGIGFVTLDGPGRSVKEMKAEVLGGSYELEVAHGRVAVDVAWDALYDPRSERLHGADESVQSVASAATTHSLHQRPSTSHHAL
jgi:4-methylaminobutanoate oxidase (formaldehyde-forming)